MPQVPNDRYEFGPFCLEMGDRVLLCEGRLISLTPKAFEILALLVQNHGRPLSKEELMRHAWPDTFVDESNLSQHIFQLRKALGDAGGHSYIETVPRRGYRFTQNVKKIGLNGQAENKEVLPSPQTVIAPTASSPLKRLQPVALILTALLIGFVIIHFVRERLSAPSSVHAAKVMLVVLPFDNLSGDPQEEYFANGLTEETITQLSNLEPGRLGVIARTSAMQYKDTHKDIREIANELGVDYLLEGSVRRDGERVRVSTRLIQARDQTNLWAKNYDRNLQDILALQSDLARAVAGQIQLQLTPEENARLASAPARDAVAYELYLKGRYVWNRRTPDDYVKAIDYFQQAIARDPEYAQAYAGLADAYALLGSSWGSSIPRSQAMPKAKEAALKALQLDDSLAEAHTSLAFVMMHFEWNWPDSEKEFKRAIDLNPNYATARQWYAFWFASQGQVDKALEQMELARRADPLSLIIMADTSEMLLYAGRIDSSVQEARKATDLDPSFAPAYMCLADCYIGTGNYQAAVQALEKILALNSVDTWALSRLAVADALAGDRSNAESVLRKVRNSVRNEDEISFQMASIYSALGEKELAFTWLEKAYRYRDGALILLNWRKEFQPLRSDSRYDELVKRLQLPVPDGPRASM